MIIPLSIMSIIPLCGWYSITHMLHVCYIYLHNWVIYVGQMLGWIIFQHHGLHMGSHSPLFYHRMIDRMDIVEIPSVMETSEFVQPFQWEDQWWYCLVVDLALWKIMEFVSWDDDIPNICKDNSWIHLEHIGTSSIITQRIHGAGIYANIWGTVYW